MTVSASSQNKKFREETHVDEDQGSPKWNPREHRHPIAHARITRPPKPEEADNEGDAAHGSHWESRLWWDRIRRVFINLAVIFGDKVENCLRYDDEFNDQR